MTSSAGDPRPGHGGGRAWPTRRPVLVVALALALAGVACLYGAHPLRYRTELAATAARHGFDPLFLAAVVKVESGFDPLATSSRGARGLMQVMPETARWVAGELGWSRFDAASLYDPAVSLTLGGWYLAYLRDREFGGRLVPALAAYNAGRDAVRLWLARGSWDGTVAGADSIPYPETRSFVRRVGRVYRVYRLLYFRWRPEPAERLSLGASPLSSSSTPQEAKTGSSR